MADEPDPQKAVVVLISEDPSLSASLAAASGAMGLEWVLMDSSAPFDAHGPPAPRPLPLTEPLSGSLGAMLRAMVHMQPALILVDLTCQAIPWAQWIQTLKTSAATRRIPILAFSHHPWRQGADLALDLGADAWTTRDALLADPQRTLAQHLEVPNRRALEESCRAPLPPLAQQGIQAVAAGHYYQAHELLEEAWMEAQAEAGYLLRALLQLAVTYLQLERGNLAGAKKMLLRMRRWLHPLPDRCRGVDVGALRRHVALIESTLEAEGLDADISHLFQPIPLI